jgi:PAS domain S-box-containing protein
MIALIQPAEILAIIAAMGVTIAAGILYAMGRKQRSDPERPAQGQNVRLLERTRELTREKQLLQDHITESRRAQDALQQSEEKYRILVENANDAILIAQEGVIKFCNPKTQRMLNYSLDELSAMPFTNIIHEQDRELVVDHYTRRMRGEEVTSRYRFRALPKEGGTIWVEINSVMIPWQGMPATLSFLRDISEQVEAESARRETEEQLHSILDNTSAVVYMKSTEGRYLLINRRFETLFDVTKAEVIGRTDDDLFPPDVANSFRANDQQVLQRGSLMEFEERTTQGDDPIIYLSNKFPLFNTSGEVYAVCGISTDITDQKRAEADLRDAKAAAESADRAKSRFLANMSHEIRTPMNGIIGMTELMLTTSLDAQQHRYCDAVLESAEFLLSLINTILDFSKIGVGKLHLDPHEFDLRNDLSDTVNSLALRAHEKGLELVCHICPDVPDRVVGDSGRLRQIIYNLVGNAIKFTTEGEVVLDVGIESQDDQTLRLEFSVRDTGLGIPEDKQGIIFDAFRQADESTTREYGGSGLGLAICSQLVQLMDGNIRVESQEHQGSTFIFGAKFGKCDKPDPVSPLAESLQGTTALIVDQNAASRRSLEDLFRHWSLKPTSVPSAAEAQQAMERAAQNGAPFPLVLVDAELSDPDGYTLSREIGSAAEPASVILMVRHGKEQSDLARRERSLAVTFLTKPIKQSDLMQAIATSLGAQPNATRPATQPAHGLLTKTSHPLRILLAEDNAINREVATRMLKTRGHKVHHVDNGLKVIAALAEDTFDVVLMDVQMPEMGGIEATTEIRRNEPPQQRIPIIAMTAHAMKGDRERCLAAGMDDYVSKPIRARQLIDAVEQAAKGLSRQRAAGSSSDDHHTDSKEVNELFNRETALACVNGDLELLREIIVLFLDDSQRMTAELREAIVERDPTRLQRVAHTLKNSLGYFGVEKALQTALALEAKGRETDLEGVEELFDTLVEQLERLEPQLTAFDEENRSETPA